MSCRCLTAFDSLWVRAYIGGKEEHLFEYDVWREGAGALLLSNCNSLLVNTTCHSCRIEMNAYLVDSLCNSVVTACEYSNRNEGYDRFQLRKLTGTDLAMPTAACLILSIWLLTMLISNSFLAFKSMSFFLISLVWFPTWKSFTLWSTFACFIIAFANACLLPISKQSSRISCYIDGNAVHISFQNHVNSAVNKVLPFHHT